MSGGEYKSSKRLNNRQRQLLELQQGVAPNEAAHAEFQYQYQQTAVNYREASTAVVAGLFIEDSLSMLNSNIQCYQRNLESLEVDGKADTPRYAKLREQVDLLQDQRAAYLLQSQQTQDGVRRQADDSATSSKDGAANSATKPFRG
jgi:hypothetical protein